MSPSFAASASIMSSGAFTSRPSIEKVISLGCGRGIRHSPRELRHAACASRLAAELGDHRADRHRHRVAEYAQAVADDLLLHRGHDVESIGVASPASIRSSIFTVQFVPSRAGRALAARLVAVEARRLERDVEDRRRVATTMIAPEPSMLPALGEAVEVVGERSRSSAGQHWRTRAGRKPSFTERPGGGRRRGRRMISRDGMPPRSRSCPAAAHAGGRRRSSFPDEPLDAEARAVLFPPMRHRDLRHRIKSRRCDPGVGPP